jgi:hypothetical protein
VRWTSQEQQLLEYLLERLSSWMGNRNFSKFSFLLPWNNS